MPTWFEAVALSRDVYQEPDRPPLPYGWVKLIDSSQTEPPFTEDGYFGAMYYKDLGGGNYDLVVAHRGTPSTWSWSAIEDIEYWIAKKTPAQYLDAAKPFVEYVKTHYKSTFPKSIMWLTYVGHSLGAILAELCVAQLFDGYAETGITFESPGSMTTIQKLMASRVLPENAIEWASQGVAMCNADVDAINTCQPQIAASLTTPGAKVGYHFDMGVDEEPCVLSYFLDFTLKDQHKIINLYNYWKTNCSISPNKSLVRTTTNGVWPIGLTSGYKYYLTYDNHPDYWDGYMKKAWDTYPYIRKNYNNDYDKYVASFIQLLAELKKQVDTAEVGISYSKPTILWQVFEVLIARIVELENENKDLQETKQMLLGSFRVLNKKYRELKSQSEQISVKTEDSGTVARSGYEFFSKPNKTTTTAKKEPETLIEVNASLVQRIKHLRAENDQLLQEKTDLISSCRLVKDKIDSLQRAENKADEDMQLSFSSV